jgi:alpha-galactosidase
MGWNTWCTLDECAYDLCYASEIMSIADAMATNGMKELGYEYINLDDCWADYRDSDGNIVPDMKRFPQGIVPVVEYVKSKGLKFGLVMAVQSMKHTLLYFHE